MDENNWYNVGYKVFWYLLFVGTWIYCVFSYGFLVGVSLGWIPSIIFASIVAYLWPLASVIILYVIYMNLYH
ncbi:protein of unknown function [Maridesulfovibrio hydrothermalis AM13 = DSM 14728]|uniref:Uncharacterized protein n=1 Tax=Maridesulfovibrio hydrothermalis AM13 = DSM 14728 TaxID=1121451 RepID=L0RIX4_9BACT|nr:protein of unknown function [Maridesulfovibrio hydrothermalis AM13 = DSM 14728]